MKKRLLVSSALMLVLTAVAATSSTFAWFSVNRKGTVESPDMTATAKDGGLEITNSSNDVTDLYDVSSKDGKTFYKPVLGPASTESTPSFVSCPVVYSGQESDTNTNYFMELKMAFTSTSALDVYLSKDTKIDITTNGANEAALNSLRIAFLPANSSYVVENNATPLLVYAPKEETNMKYVSGTTITNGNLTETNYTADELGASGIVQNGEIIADDLTTKDNTSKYYMGSFASNESLYIVARMWLEGTDEQCTNAAITGVVKANLSFYGLE